MLPWPEEPSVGGRRREAGTGRSGMMCWVAAACPQDAAHPGPPGSKVGTQRGQSHCQEMRRDLLLDEDAGVAGGLDSL